MKTPVRFFLFLAILAVSAAAIAAGDEVTLSADGSNIEFLSSKVTEAESFTLTIMAPDGRTWREDYAGFHLPEIDLRSAFDDRLPDGQYHYEILPHSAPLFGTVAPELRGLEARAGAVPSADAGTFTVGNGRVLDPNMVEPAQDFSAPLAAKGGAKPANSDNGPDDETIQATVLTNADGVIRSSLCVGSDCPDSPSFGFDTIRLMENNTRFQFTDTSSVGGFPSRNWQIRANDSTNGGSEYLAFVDQGASGNSESGTISFQVTGGAPANSLVVANTGRVGFRTASPVLDLHVNTSNTPGLRLEQNTSGGFSAQTWDIAGNEANFFIRDVTSGSRLPFRIRPGAPTSSIDIAANGNVGIGTGSPQTNLHVRDSSGTTADRNLLTLENAGGSRIYFHNNALPTSGPDSASWVVSTRTQGFRINRDMSGQVELDLLNNGNLIIAGTLTQGSSRSIKERIVNIDPTRVLSAISRLSFSEWSYSSAPENRHFGPMAEDFFEVFGLGGSNRHIAPGDMAGLAMAASKALAAENGRLKAQLDQLQREYDDVSSRIGKLESLLMTQR